MDLSRRSRLPPLIAFLIIVCVQSSQARFFGDRLKRQNGANMYLPASSIVPGGEGNDPNEWTEWSSPSECSRSCGGGVSYQTRECRRTGPDGSPLCNGGNRRYFSCNTQDCPEDEPDFRAQQCSRFNNVPFDGIYYNWVPYKSAPNPCELNCMPKGERFYYRHKAKVIDGTRCNDEDLNVCVDGQCLPVGCDMMLGSNAKEDNCRQCGGDGTTCRTLKDRFTTNNLAAGYNDILLVPSGATNIRITETEPSNNYLACRNLTSHYYLNGNWRIDFPRPMFFAGSWWTYQRKPHGFAAPDQLTCRGPITESIYIVVLVQDKNVSVDYEYSIPQTVISNTPAVYNWTHMEFGPCSASCGGGIQHRNVSCNNRFNLDKVDDHFCDERTKPVESQECGTEPCAPHWETSEWGKCSKGCGSDGTQDRNVTCERISPTGERTVEDDSVCLQEVGNKPATQQECNRDVKNCPKYHLGPWTPCHKLCGEGKKTRKVTCYIEENGRKRVLSDEDCVEEKPETEATCMLAPCEGVDWIISQWSGCDACGQTTETRTAICGSKSGKVYPDEFCAPEVPLLSRPCESKKCKTQWFTSEWSKCSSPCGKGVQSRIVLCGEFDGNTVTKVTDESKCDAATKPEASKECEGEEKECPGQWFTGPWGECSKTCGGGERQREVMCLANGIKSDNCDEDKIESISEKCNTHACTDDEVLPVDSADKDISDDDDEEDCEEEEDEDVKVVTAKMSEDLKISDGIELDEETTVSSFITDELMMSDSTPPTDTTDEAGSTDATFTTVEGSGDSTESTSASSMDTVEGSGDTETTSESGVTETQTGSTEGSDATEDTTESLLETTGSSISDDTTEAPTTDTTESAASTESSTDITKETEITSYSTQSFSEESTESSAITDGLTEGTEPTDMSTSTDATQTTDISASTDSSEPTETTGATDSSSISGSTYASTEFSTTSDVSDTTDVSDSTDTTSSTDVSETTDASVSTDVTSSTDVTATTEVSPTSDASTETSASTSSDVTDTTSSDTTVTTDTTSTDSTPASDSTTEFTTSTDISGPTEASSSTTESSSGSTDVSDTTDASVTTDVSDSDVSVTTEVTDTTEESTSTESSDSTTGVSETTDASATSDASASTDTTVSSDTTDISGSTESQVTTDSSVSTDSSDVTSESSSTDESTESSGSTVTNAETTLSTDTTSDSSSDASTVSTDAETTEIDSTTPTVITDSTTDSGISTSTDVTEDTTTDAGEETSSSETTGISDVTTEASSDFTTLESETTDSASSEPTTTSQGLSTSSDLFDSTTESSGDSSLSTEEATTVDIWTSEDDDFEKSTPNTLQAVITKESKPKKCKRKKPKDCSKTKYGCCPHGKTVAKGPFDEGCPIPKTCKDTEFGCCSDGVSPAAGKNNEGCPKSQCEETLFGCCPDKYTPAEGEDNEGCPEPTTVPPTTTTEMPEEETTISTEPALDNYVSTEIPESAESTEVPETTEVPVTPEIIESCSFASFGCCPDGTTAASGPDFAGCDVAPPTSSTDCRFSEFGCCPDGRTPATGADNQGCAACTYEPYGCCPDNETPAHGPLGEGCCLNSQYGCCPDNINSARGSDFEGCDCQYSPYGCCPDNKTAARGHYNEGCGCENTQFGCCPDKLTPAQGPKFEGCACHTLQFGCCPDGITIAQGPHHYGCHCSQTEFKCCPDEKTPAKGPNFEGCTCLESKYGCCPDGVTSAQGNKFEGCENVKEPPQKACGLPKETGPCGNFSIKYFFDTSYGACAKFWYGGCEGNGNRFESESECKETCQEYKGKEACYLPKSSGPCTGDLTKWYFDAERGRCEQFKYGGCFGTNNRFDTKEECQSFCAVSETTPPCDQPMDEGPCEGNFERWFYDNQTDVCRPFRYGGCKGNKNNYPTEHACNYHCRQPGVHKDYCSLPKQAGDCSEKHPRWYFSETEKKCLPFYYTGCGGNKNNFPSLESCENHCPKEVAKDICEIPASVGDCNNYEPMWYYDTKDQRCRQFYYGGCGGNENKFTSEESCMRRCEKKPEPVPEPEQPAVITNVCDEKPDQGPCADYTLVWHYDKENDQCRQFYYGGCEGNGNRFETKEECAQQCASHVEPNVESQPVEEPSLAAIPEPAPAPEEPVEENVCLLAQDMGDCDNYVSMWYYDSQDSRCTMFYYGGCGGNGNRFATEEECNRRCSPEAAPEAVPEAAPEPEPESVASPEVESSNKCFLPVAHGNCLENEVRWYYNSEDGVCDQFVYTGCGGNANNYATESECEDECFAVHSTCQLPALAGNCNETMIRWHYSESEGRCVEFEFSGCRGNRNNFVTERECMSMCGGDEPQVPSYSVCDLPLEAGECDNSTTAWHYDRESMSCVAFTYTGCGGNGNRFLSREQCERQCGEFKGVDVCNEDVSSGPCRQWQTRFYFNKETRTCEPFTYGGCQGTANRFESRAECESRCIIGQEPTYSDTKDICKQQVDVGRCNGQALTERRWYYDDARGNCVSFIYSGCAGNQNNFRSYESCYTYCSKADPSVNEVLPVNRCEEYEKECSALSCPYGKHRVAVDEECSRCECDNPCADYVCPDGQQCAVEVSSERSGEFKPECRLINKPGTCPHLTASDGVCGRECHTDADCRENNKCCSNGCGFVCVHPAVPTRPTTAPTTPAPVVVYPQDVKVSLIPKEKAETDVNTPLGGIAVLRCFATGNPVPNVTWSRNNVVVDTNQGRYVLTSSGDLTIVQVRQTDSGSYVCLASNGLGEPVRREIELQVTDPVPMPAYVYGDKNVTQIVTLNRPAVVRCPAGGHPEPMVHWWRNRRRLPLLSNRFELTRDYSLTFRSVQLTDLGPYTCEAWNRLSVRPSSIKVTLVAVGPVRAANNDESKYLQYIIESPMAPVTQRPTYPYRPTRPPAVPPPYVVVPVNAVIGKDPSNTYQPGSTVALSCSVQGYPTPNVTWTKDGLPLVPNERIQISVREPYRVIINNVSTADSGKYGCKAANAVNYGFSEENINIESTIPLNPECIDNGHFANCNLIVRGRYCKNKYYAKFCCRSCALAGQL